jgi:hypothetical protein
VTAVEELSVISPTPVRIDSLVFAAWAATQGVAVSLFIPNTALWTNAFLAVSPSEYDYPNLPTTPFVYFLSVKQAH